MSDEEYPDEAELTRIREWPHTDAAGWFAYIKGLWRYAESGYWTESRPGLYEISTGGWSGNEEIIAAMRANTILWSLTWISSRRGGHYEFEVRNV